MKFSFELSMQEPMGMQTQLFDNHSYRTDKLEPESTLHPATVEVATDIPEGWDCGAS